MFVLTLLYFENYSKAREYFYVLIKKFKTLFAFYVCSDEFVHLLVAYTMNIAFNHNFAKDIGYRIPVLILNTGQNTITLTIAIIMLSAINNNVNEYKCQCEQNVQINFDRIAPVASFVRGIRREKLTL